MKKLITVALLSISAMGCTTQTVATEQSVEKSDDVMTCMALNCVKDTGVQGDEARFNDLMQDIASVGGSTLIDGKDVFITIPTNVIFEDVEKSIMKGDVMESLQPIATFTENRTDLHIEVTAHTDRSHSKGYAMKMTNAQAMSVDAVLDVLEIGAKSSHIEGMGFTEAGGCNLSTPDCNERITIRLKDIFL